MLTAVGIAGTVAIVPLKASAQSAPATAAVATVHTVENHISHDTALPATPKSDNCVSDLDKKLSAVTGGTISPKVDLVVNAGMFGTDAIIPPGAGLFSAAENGVSSMIENARHKRPIAMIYSFVSMLPALPAGFFGGGAAADAVQGGSNVVMSKIGANKKYLPQSDSQNFLHSMSCVVEEEPKNPTSGVRQINQSFSMGKMSKPSGPT
jgi:hypothetical protein